MLYIYNEMKKQLSKEICSAKRNFNLKLQTELKENPCKLHVMANRLCSLKKHINPVEKIALQENIYISSALNRINEYFAKVSNQYDPIDDMYFSDINT